MKKVERSLPRLPSVEEYEAGMEISKFCTLSETGQVGALPGAPIKRMRRKGPERPWPITKTNKISLHSPSPIGANEQQHYDEEPTSPGVAILSSVRVRQGMTRAERRRPREGFRTGRCEKRDVAHFSFWPDVALPI